MRGNCDSEVDQMLLNFPMLSDQAWVILPSGVRMFLTHGHLYNGQKKPPLKPGDVIAHGHTHLPLADYDAQNHFIFNPGSTTFPKGGNVASFGYLQDNTFTVRSFDGDIVKTGTLSL